MKKLTFILIAILGVLGCRGNAETAIVPYDPTKPVAQQQPDRYYLPYERFLALWEAAKKNRAGEQQTPAPMAFALSAARYEGRVGEQALTFTAKLDVTTANEQWVKVPLPFTNVKVSGLKVDGVTAVFDGAAVLIEKPGRHEVEISFEIPRETNVKRWRIGVPRTAATLVALMLPDSRTTALIAPGSGTIERVENGQRTVSAAVGGTDFIEMVLEAPAGEGRLAEPASVLVRATTTVTRGVELSDAAFVFTFPGARQDKFTIYLEKGLRLVDIGVADFKSWKLVDEGARQVLELALHEPVRESFSCRVVCERDAMEFPADRTAPVFSAEAKRVEIQRALFSSGRIEVTAAPEASMRQVEFRRDAVAGARFVGAFGGEGKLGYHVALAEPRREARVDYVYQVNRRKIELIASLMLRAKGDDIFEVAVTLPAGFDVQTVQSPRLRDWWRDGAQLRVRFKDATPENTALAIYLVRQYAAAPTELDVRPLTLTDFKKVEGEAVIAAHKGVDAAIKLNAEGREMAPELAATDFQILPPLERKRGFSFKTQNFSAQVTLAALPAKMDALWVLHAQAHESWLSLSTHAQLKVRQGSVDRVAFTLPATLAEAHIRGGDVRETRSRVEGDRRIYEVQFQDDVYDTVEWTIDVELPNNGEAALPAIAFPEAATTTGYVLTDNASEFEMKLKTSGVDPAPLTEIPFLPTLSKNAGVFRVQPGWSVSVAVEQLEKASSRAAFVAWAEITTALRRDGTEWHRATYRLQNRSLQFLPIKLPARAELVSARVAGQGVRADKGANGAILVPLIKTKPGDLAYNVEIVYRTKDSALSWRSNRRYDDPELPGITIEKTFWNVWIPDDRELSDSGGNMQPVVAELNRTEKVEGLLQEMRSLSVVMNSGTTSELERENAKRNWFFLRKSVEDEVRVADAQRRSGGPATPSPTPAEDSVGKKGVKAQQEEVQKKRQVLGGELQKLDMEQKAAEQNAAGQVQSQLAGDASGRLQQQQQRQQVFTGDYDKGMSQHRDGEWKANKQAPTEQIPAVPKNSGNNVYFNDNIVLNNGALFSAPPVSGPVTQGEVSGGKKPMGNVQADDQSKAISELGEVPALRFSIESVDELTVTKSPGEKPAAQPEGKDKALTKDARRETVQEDVVLNTARGNRARGDQMQDGAKADAPALPGAAKPIPAPMLDLNQPVLQAPMIPGLDPLPPSQVVQGGFSGGGAQQGQVQMQVKGRISLDVDFPTEGQLLHFQKVKSNADLRITMTEIGSFVRWKWLGVSLVCGGALVGLRRLIERRRVA